MSSKRKTRSEASTNLSKLIGVGKEMSETDLPTQRDILQYGLFLKETNPEFIEANYKELAKGILIRLRQIWERASVRFKPPVTAVDRTILGRLVTLLEKSGNIAWKRITNAKELDKFWINLDKLFDITKCNCSIVDCHETVCKGCHCGEKGCCGCPRPGVVSALPPCHVLCSCPVSQKLPLAELSFLRAQREKVGSKSIAMILNVDRIESNKIQVADKKVEEKQKRIELKTKKDQENAEKELMEKFEAEARVAEFWKDTSEEIDPENNEVDIDITPWKEKNNPIRNLNNIRNVALASIRFGVSDNATAAICNATLLDYGVLTNDNTKDVIDAKKVQRHKDKVYKELQAKADMKLNEGGLLCILFDGRKDWTLVYEEVEGSSQPHPAIRKEEHYSVVAEPGGHYLFHFTPEPADETHSAAEQIAITLVEWMVKHGVDTTLQFIGGDSTNVNSGIWGGVFQYVEKMLDRPLNWIVCGLHLNELPLRHLMIDLDGPTTSASGFTGPIGKAIMNATDLPIKTNFKKISIGPDLPLLPDDVVKDLSTDQKYGYEIVKAIRTGILPQRLANSEIGQYNHSRWLTFANRICRIYVSDHGFKGQDAKNLQLLAEYVTGVYFPIWFMYKIKNNWIMGPTICLEQLRLTLQQNKKVIKIVFPHLESSAWWAHSEMILQSLLCSEDDSDRKFAIEKILDLRQNNIDSRRTEKVVRTRTKAKLNRQATSLQDLIIWDKNNVCEPILTQSLTDEDIKEFETQPMIVPPMPVHGQSMERCVKEVTAASESVFGYERRDGFIRGRLEHRSMTGGLLKSKQDHARIVGIGQ